MLDTLDVKIFADGADLDQIAYFAGDSLVKGFTTNPALMRSAGVVDYKKFANDALALTKKPISFEVFADEPEEMLTQALVIASWGDNVYVKIPVVNTKGVFMGDVIKTLAERGVKVNVTAVFTVDQAYRVGQCYYDCDTPAVVSVFAGRIADSGRDPLYNMKHCRAALCTHGNIELLWASPRQIYDIVQADAARCQIITLTPALIMKAQETLGRDLLEYSRETVQMFYDAAKLAAYTIEVPNLHASVGQNEHQQFPRPLYHHSV